MCISDIIALLSALGTIAMAGFAFVSIRQNNKQLAELKRQWHEQNRPRLMPFFVSYHGRSTPQGYLRIKNISNVPAFGVSIEISSQDENVTNDSYIRYNELATAFQNTTFPLEPLGTKDYEFIVIKWPEEQYQGRLSVRISYNNIYSEVFSLFLSEFDVLGDSITNENAIADRINELTSKVEDIGDRLSRL